MQKFSVSVWVREGAWGILPIGSIEEARAYLARWPVGGRGPLYYVAANSIESARSGSISADDAKSAFLALLDDTGALAEAAMAT